MKRKHRQKNGLKVLASGSLSIARAHADQALQKTEAWLEREIQRENAIPPTHSFAKFKRTGGKILHSKQVLLAVVILNVLDCMLVLSELILDIHYVTDLLHDHERSEGQFLEKMHEKYPVELSEIHETEALFPHLVKANIQWDQTPLVKHNNNLAEVNGIVSHGKKRRSIAQVQDHHTLRVKGENETNSTSVVVLQAWHSEHSLVHSLTEDLAHGLHKASITILAILVVQTILKVICVGRHLLERKIEVFDGIVVIASFILDLVFIKGLTAHKVQDFVFILAFIVPWRVLRVVNSLLVAVMDHEHFRLKLLYKQKKSVTAHLKDTKSKVSELQRNLEKLEALCLKAGIPKGEITDILGSQNQNGTYLASGFGLFPNYDKSSDHVPISVPEDDETHCILEHDEQDSIS